MYLDNNFFSNVPFFAGCCYYEVDDEIQVEFPGQEQYPRSQISSPLFFADGGGRLIGEQRRINGENKKKKILSRGRRFFQNCFFFWCA
jgi:hypothetical protein